MKDMNTWIWCIGSNKKWKYL